MIDEQERQRLQYRYLELGLRPPIWGWEELRDDDLITIVAEAEARELGSMKLWKLSQTVNRGWDTYDSAIVAAETAEEARLVHPDPDLKWNGEYWFNEDSYYGEDPDEDDYRIDNRCWAKPAELDVKLIGDAAPGTKLGVVLSSFNAG